MVTPAAQSLSCPCMISGVLMMVNIKTAVLWDVMLCSKLIGAVLLEDHFLYSDNRGNKFFWNMGACLPEYRSQVSVVSVVNRLCTGWWRNCGWISNRHKGSSPFQGDQTSSGTCPLSYLVSTVGFLPPGMQDLGYHTSSGTCPVSYLVSTVGSPLRGMKELGYETDHSLLSHAKLKNAWSCTSTHDMPTWHTQRWFYLNLKDYMV